MNTECNICNKKILVDTHHIQSSCYGGVNKEWNRCKLCPNCHRKVHTGSIIIEGWFSTSISNILVYRNKGDQSITSVEDPKVWIYNKE